MRSPYRLDRLNAELKQALAGILTLDVVDPRLEMVSVVSVAVSRDLSYARIYYGVIGDQQTRTEAAEALQKAKRYIRLQLGNKVRMRIVPGLDFRLDVTLDEVYKLESIISEVKESGPLRTVSYERCSELLWGARNPAYIAHVFPDCDTIGSALALWAETQRRGNGGVVYCEHQLSEAYSFLPGYDQICWGQLPDERHDLLVSLDCGALARAGIYRQYIEENAGKIPLLNIDHHISNDYFGDYNLVDAACCANAEIVYQLLKKSELPISRKVAEALYLGIATDTGNFRYANTTAATLTVAAELAGLGVDFQLFSDRLYHAHSTSYHSLLARALPKIELRMHGQVAILVVSRELLAESGADYAETEGLVEYLISLAGTKIAVIFKEYERRVIKISFRCKQSLDASELAAKLGGGGHQNAAGCLLETPLTEAYKRVVTQTEKWFSGQAACEEFPDTEG